MPPSQAYYAATKGLSVAALVSDLLALMELRSLMPRDVATGTRIAAVLLRLERVVRAGRRARIDYRRNGLVVGEAFVALRELEQVVERLQLSELQAA